MERRGPHLDEVGVGVLPARRHVSVGFGEECEGDGRDDQEGGDSDCGGTTADRASDPESFTGGFFGINQDLVSTRSAVVADNYPNPFVGETTIRYAVETATNVTIMVFDNSGRRIETLVNERKEAGEYESRFEGPGLPPGVYYARISTGNGQDVQVLKLMKQ